MPQPFGRHPLKQWQGFLFATVVTAVTLGVRLALHGPLEGQPTLVIFTVPIMLSAYAGGSHALVAELQRLLPLAGATPGSAHGR